MIRRRFSLWDLIFVALLVASLPAAIFHFSQGRWGNGLMAVLAFVAGLVVLGIGFYREDVPTPQQDPVAIWQREPRAPRPSVLRNAGGRVHDWLTLSVLSGFAATALMSMILLLGYGIAAAFGSAAPGAGMFRHWLHALVHNPVTATTHSNLAIAVVLHFVAGIVWAVVYAGFAEPRLRGAGWQRGLTFAVIPWLVSLVVFLPLAGGGLFGASVHAGPLPILGNLVLHAVYGLTLGQVFISEGLMVEEDERVDSEELPTLQRIERGMALAVLPGLIIGGVVGALGSGFFAPGESAATVGVVGAIIGCVVGILIGSFAGGTSRTAKP